MKKVLSIFLLSAVLLLSGCEEVYYPVQLQGRWASVVNAKESSLLLNFEGKTLTVTNGSRNYKPFTSDDTWDYYMTHDSILYVTRYTYYDGDSYDSETYRLALSFSDNYNTLMLTYDPFFGPSRTYTFIRRN